MGPINIKYHVVSLAAVFLALGVGILVGSSTNFFGISSILNRQDKVIRRLEFNYREIRREVADARKELSTSQDYTRMLEGEVIPKLVGDKLDGLTFGVVTIGEVKEGADEEPVVNSLKTSGANVEFTMRTSIASLRKMADDDFGDFIPRLGKELSRGAKFGTTYTGVFAKDGSLVSGGFDSPVSGIVFVLAPGNTAQDVREVLLPLENVILENGGAAVNAALDADGDLEPVFNQSRHPFFKDTATLKSQIDMILRVDEIFKQKKETHTVAK